MTQGIKRDVDELVKWLETRACQMPIKNKGKKEFLLIDMQLRPIQLWSMAIPKEARDIFLNTMTWTGGDNLKAKMLRRILKDKKIDLDKIDKSRKFPMPSDLWVSSYLIGEREDNFGAISADGTKKGERL
jgi:hypothetical protein